MWAKFNNWFDGGGGLKVCAWFAVSISVGGFLYFFFNNEWNLAYYDALSHLNSGRKVVDNLTPGFAQLGGLWLPLTHILLIPFIWNDFMWQSGLAGYIVSGFSFIFSAVLIHKLINLVVQNQKSALLGSLVYMTNINIVYLQTMGMMESLFNLTIVGSIYYIVRWARGGGIPDLIIGGLFVAACTLTRYEGYSVLLMAVVLIAVISLWKNRSMPERTIVEGNIILFTTVASVGVLLWSVYLFAIFGDPLHWLHPYDNIVEKPVQVNLDSIGAENNNVSKVVQVSDVVFRPVYYHDAAKTLAYLFSATAGAVGMIVFCAALFGLPFLIFRIRQAKDVLSTIIVMGISVSIFLFLYISMYFGKISVWGPSFLSNAIFDRSSNFIEEAGIRYTIALLPFVAIILGIAFSRSWRSRTVVAILIAFQLGTVFSGQLFLTYNLSLKWRTVYGHEIDSSKWFRGSYSGGLILVSSLSHEAEMFHNGIPYKNYIHEGNGKYWTESLKNPQTYASWIIMNKQVVNSTSGVWGTDIITNRAVSIPTFLDGFSLVYEDQLTQIYKSENSSMVEQPKY